MKPKFHRKEGGRGKQSRDKLHKFMVSVQNFVKSEGGHDESESHGHVGMLAKRKSRKELRKEKRKVKKKKKMKAKQPAEEIKRSVSVDAASRKTPPAIKTKPESTPAAAELSDQEKKPKRRVHFEKTAPQPEKKVKMHTMRKKALMEANEEEDREIKKLEKRLGLNKRRNKKSLPQSFISDGLDYILGILEPGGSGLYDSDEELDSAKAKSRLEKLEELGEDEEEEDGDHDEEGDTGDEGENDDKGGDEEDAEEIEEDEEDEEEELEEEGEEEVEEEEEEDGEEEVEEGENASEEEDEQDEGNSQENSSTGKYVPPHLREAADSKRKAELERLKRNLKGLINRLSEPNMGSISGQVEEMYMSNSRKDMNDALTEVLISACVTPALMTDRLLMEHMLLVSVLHHTVGLEVGAHFLETVVRRFDETLRDGSSTGKESSNLASMMAHMYNFQVVHSLLLFDVLKRLLSSFTPQDVELMLLLLRNVGFSLRKDDPLGLKELISEAQRKASAEGPRFSDQTRVRFMLETMLALKNNDVRKIPGYDPEPVERLRKLQRSLIQNRASGTDVKLRVSLENLLDAQRVGRWWIVGSSWSGAPMINDDKPTAQPVQGEQFSAKVLELARKQRMNTDVRRNIFCIIMTSEDYLDAFEKLLRLGLKGQQERDIIHVLLDCCLQEKSFNGFYAVLAEKFCARDRHFQMTFQFCLWDKFKELPTLSSSSFTNLVQMVTHLLTKNSLSLSILKAIEFGELDKPKVKFLRQVLSKLLQQTEEVDLVQIFSRISGIPKLGMLREGLKLFIRHFLLRSAQTERTLLTERAEVAVKAMEARDAKLRL
ncbi:nucleolar MIF4G domain-containing protein 1 [Ictalurus punctatus]|uniref:Nucleolar MIF4G domain-containing protein 1 n=1 Tax=Ictalurus punctatus TaxID=7998 RepID=A0A2D0RF50_ICTPU|nr:nucleolar MIF4G domain-containing protein 1 [Ictalurus punctatus]